MKSNFCQNEAKRRYILNMSIVTDIVADNETVTYILCTKHEIKLIIINISIAKNTLGNRNPV